jgi:hypothetical protein
MQLGDGVDFSRLGLNLSQVASRDVGSREPFFVHILADVCTPLLWPSLAAFTSKDTALCSCPLPVLWLLADTVMKSKLSNVKEP